MFAEAAERFFANRRGRPDEGTGERSCDSTDNDPNGGSSGRSRSNGLGASTDDLFGGFGLFDLFHARSSSSYARARGVDHLRIGGILCEAMLSRRSFLTVSSAAALAACQRSDGRRVIGVVPKGTSHLFWQTIHAGALKAGDEFGLEVFWQAPQLEIDSSRQIAIVENLISRQVDGILLAPVDEESLVSPVERAAERGIPVAIFDSSINTDKIISFVATDNFEAGVMAGRRMGAILGGQGKVGIIGFMPGSASTVKRENGFIEALNEFPDIEMVGLRYNMSDRAKAMAESENLMTAHPDLAGLFADNESATDGTVRAVKQRGAVEQVKIVGFDSSEELIDELRAGTIDSIVVQDPFRMAYECMKAMADHLAGRDPLAELDSGSYLVTRENVDDPEIQRVIFPDIDTWLNGA
jgi:ribose transport system substrate-binding protein